MLGYDRPPFFTAILLLYISIWFLLLPAAVSQIPLGSRLSVERKNQWVSSNGDFAIGFFNRFNQYGIGIYISSGLIPVEKQPLVWVAGADLRVGDKSYFELTKDGELVLFDSTRGVVTWTSKTTNSSVSLAVLQDNGNFVLLNQNKETVWQSFDTPSDTLLPGQNFSSYQMLRAASRNSVSSLYSLHMGVLGDLQLKWESEVIYWRTPVSPLPSVLRAMLNSNGTIRLFDQKSNPVWSVYGEDHGDSDVKFRILRLDVDGNLRLYSWVKKSNSWQSVWRAVENQCNVFATCGLTGICAFNETGFPVCKCPFSLTPASTTSKCLLPYQQTCESGSSMVTFDHTSLYAIYPPNETIISLTSLDQCKILCQQDPLCTAATFMNDGTGKCRMKKTQYVSGQSGLSVSSVSFVKRCSDPLAVLPNLSKSKPALPAQNTQPREESDNKEVCISCVTGVAGGTFAAFVMIQLGLLGGWIYRRRKSFTENSCPAYKGECTNPSGLIALTYGELKDLTEDFKDRIETNLFKGVLVDGQPVVVKDLGGNVDARKFRCGILKLGSFHHKNLVKLQGYCCESSHRFLVYEYVKNGPLDKCLEDPEICKKLTWRRRVDICLAVARGVSYLHMGCREFVGHGSLSCENVVLDENLEAKVTDFGLKSFLGDRSDGDVCGERDVRDFGYIVLALVSGNPKANNDFDWAYEKWVGGNVKEIIDKRMEGDVNVDELERVLRIMFWCFQADERMRPSMGEIVNVLEGAMAVDPPPPPSACRKLVEDEAGTGSESEV